MTKKLLLAVVSAIAAFITAQPACAGTIALTLTIIGT
jgi:hypothetical protein